jgi:hypothetical protein
MAEISGALDISLPDIFSIKHKISVIIKFWCGSVQGSRKFFPAAQGEFVFNAGGCWVFEFLRTTQSFICTPSIRSPCTMSLCHRFKFPAFMSFVSLVLKFIALQRRNIPENIKLLYKLDCRALLEAKYGSFCKGRWFDVISCQSYCHYFGI